MAYQSLSNFVDLLDKSGELIRIKEYVDPKLEMAEITDRISKSGDRNKSLLFENSGTDFPVLINSMGSYKRICMALGVNNLDEIGKEIEGLFKMLTGPKQGLMDKFRMLPQLGKISSWMPSEKQGRGSCQEVIMKEPDLTKLPVMTCWPADGGPFLTLPIIHTVDPENGIRNVGLYRMQVFSPNLTGMHWHKHKVSAGHFNMYNKLGIRMPVAVALGGDPVYTYSASAPLPPNMDEYMLAGFIRKKKVELVKCITLRKETFGQDMYVPADADIIIEGYINTDEDFILEGPFGDHTGYYSLADMYPRFHVTAITHKKNAIYPSTIVGIPPQEDAWIGKATERIFISPIKLTLLPEMVDMELPIEGVFHNLTIVSIDKAYAGHAAKVMNAMWGAGQMMFNKILMIVDKDTDIHDYALLARVFSKNVDPGKHIYFSQGPMDVLDHSCSKFAFGGKMCIDATTKYPEEAGAEAAYNIQANKIDKKEILTLFPEIFSLDDSLIQMGISIVSVAINKSRKNHVRELHEKLVEKRGFENVKMILYTEPMVDVANIAEVVWRVSNNIDPQRDCYLTKSGANGLSHIGIDGTRKTPELDDFDREWPNIICADEATIKSVDEKWSRLGLGELIKSPSEKYRKQLYGNGAVAD